MQVMVNVESVIVACFAPKYFLLILTVNFIIERAISFSGFSSEAKSNFLSLSFAGAWQKLHFTPRPLLNTCITLSSSSWVIFLGKTLRFLYRRGSSAGLVAATPMVTIAANAQITKNFLFNCINHL